jgi:periplasmic divalent cation tolerance protein
MKSRKQDWPALMSRLHDLHPYDTPECIAVRIAAGAPRYMAWLEETLSGEGG